MFGDFLTLIVDQGNIKSLESKIEKFASLTLEHLWEVTEVMDTTVNQSKHYLNTLIRNLLTKSVLDLANF